MKTEVDWKFELCHVSKVNEEQKGPALMYENVKGYDIPVFTSAFTTPQRLAIALEQDPSLTMSQLSKKWMELTTKQFLSIVENTHRISARMHFLLDRVEHPPPIHLQIQMDCA